MPIQKPRYVVVANPECRRLELFSAALHKLGFAPPTVVSYIDLLTGKVQLRNVVRSGDFVRLESPGRNWEVEKALLSEGAETAARENRFHHLSFDQIKSLSFDKGRIWPSRQWFFGLRALMNEIAAQLENCAPHIATHCRPDIVTMFDKPSCQALLHSHGIPVPPALPIPSNFEEFISHLRSAGWQRAFLKLAHGSSASGVVAFQTKGSNVKATTTTEVVRENGTVQLYNSRQLKTYESWDEVSELIDALCRECMHIEKWFPKASLHGKTCDARIVVIGGRVWDGIVRLSRGPLTNLHLLNDRAPLSELRAAMREVDWNAAVQSCERVMSLFPSTLLVGVDIVFSPDFRRHAILELNVWGDLMPTVSRDGQDTYTAQIEEVLYQ